MAVTRSTATPPARDCVGCAGGMDHCHGTLIVHHDGARECTEPRCDGPDPVRHGLLLDCVELADCACGHESVSVLAAAS